MIHLYKVEGAKKTTKGQGRPKGVSPKMCIEHIKEVAPKPLFAGLTPTYLSTIHHSLQCVVCMNVLQSPIELP